MRKHFECKLIFYDFNKTKQKNAREKSMRKDLRASSLSRIVRMNIETKENNECEGESKA